MRIDKLLKLNRNLRRIEQMRQKGADDSMLAAILQHDGFDVNAEQLSALTEILEELSKRVIAREAVRYTAAIVAKVEKDDLV